MLETYGLTHLQIAVRDLERSIVFYRQLLGMDELRRLGTDCVMLRTPGTREVFTLNRDAERAELAGQMGGFAHFGFRLRAPLSEELVAEQVKRAGGTVLKQGRRGGDESYTFVADPDGYLIELFWAAD